MLMDIQQLSAKLSISVGTLYNWTSQKRIPYFKIGRKVLFDERCIDEWLEKSKVEIQDFD